MVLTLTSRKVFMSKFEGFYKGINLGGWISQCSEYTKEHYESFICEDDIKTIKSWGFDHVRLPLDYEVILDEKGNFIEGGFSYIDRCIEWCKKNSLNMILDLHKTPGYMFDTNAVPNPDAFFHDAALQDLFVKIWTELASRYASYSSMLAFELLNEIVNPKLEREWNAIASRAIKTIRGIAPDSWIVVGGVDYNSVSAVPGIDVPYDKKTVFTFHCYEPLVFTHQKAPWVKGMTADFEVSYPGSSIEYVREKSALIPQAQHGAVFAKCMDGLKIDEHFFENLFAPAIETSKKTGVPLYCGEYGVIDRAPQEDTVRWLRDIHKALEKHQIGRALWSYKEMDFGLTGSHYDLARKEITASS